jgi:integrase/recombinase XerC
VTVNEGVAGVPCRPHGLRHAGITAALDATHGDVRSIQAYSRHRDLRTILRFDDACQDTVGRIAQRLAEDAA